MRRDVGLVAVAVALLLAGVVPAAGATGTDASGSDRVRGAQVDPDDVVLSIHVRADGNATWRVEYRFRLATENETEAFERLAEDIRANPEERTGAFASQMRATVRAAENRTGRAMRLVDVTVSVEKRQLPQQYGVVTYRFTWTGFAAVEGERLRVGDAIESLFLDAETTLVLRWPEAYEATTVAPAPTDRRPDAVLWEGPVEFTAGEPTVVLARSATTPGTTAAAVTASDPARGGDVPLLPLGALGLVALAAGGGWLYARRSRGESGSASAEAETADDDQPSGALLSNEEQVLALLEEHGGRMKQKRVADELDWSAAKTSRVVGSLREEGEVETLRVGRENVVRLDD